MGGGVCVLCNTFYEWRVHFHSLLLNILNFLAYMYPLSCIFNIFWIHCPVSKRNGSDICYKWSTPEQVCRCMEVNSRGIQIIHGCTNYFESGNSTTEFFPWIYNIFKKVLQFPAIISILNNDKISSLYIQLPTTHHISPLPQSKFRRIDFRSMPNYVSNAQLPTVTTVKRKVKGNVMYSVWKLSIFLSCSRNFLECLSYHK